MWRTRTAQLELILQDLLLREGARTAAATAQMGKIVGNDLERNKHVVRSGAKTRNDYINFEQNFAPFQNFMLLPALPLYLLCFRSPTPKFVDCSVGAVSEPAGGTAVVTSPAVVDEAVQKSASIVDVQPKTTVVTTDDEMQQKECQRTACVELRNRRAEEQQRMAEKVTFKIESMLKSTCMKNKNFHLKVFPNSIFD